MVPMILAADLGRVGVGEPDPVGRHDGDEGDVGVRADGFGDRLQNLSGPAGFDGFGRRRRVGERGGDADDLLACRLVAVAPGIEQCQARCLPVPPPRPRAICSAIAWPARDHGHHGGSRAPSSSAAMANMSSPSPTAMKCPAPSTGCHTAPGIASATALLMGSGTSLSSSPCHMWTGRSIVATSKAQSPVEQFSVADQSVGAVGEAFGARVAEFLCELRVEAGSAGRSR